MFEEIIGQLETMNIPYTEDYDTGTLTIDISAADKVQVIDAINVVNASTLDFTVDENAIVVTGVPLEEPMEEEESIDYNDMALNELGDM
jgi:hypothetical protein